MLSPISSKLECHTELCSLGAHSSTHSLAEFKSSLACSSLQESCRLPSSARLCPVGRRSCTWRRRTVLRCTWCVRTHTHTDRGGAGAHTFNLYHHIFYRIYKVARRPTGRKLFGHTHSPSETGAVQVATGILLEARLFGSRSSWRSVSMRQCGKEQWLLRRSLYCMAPHRRNLAFEIECIYRSDTQTVCAIWCWYP